MASREGIKTILIGMGLARRKFWAVWSILKDHTLSNLKVIGVVLSLTLEVVLCRLLSLGPDDDSSLFLIFSCFLCFILFCMILVGTFPFRRTLSKARAFSVFQFYVMFERHCILMLSFQ